MIAEGVETQAQRAALQEMQCDHYQGYLCAPALPAADFALLLVDGALAPTTRAVGPGLSPQ